MKALVWEDGMGESYETVDIPAELEADAETWRHELVDVVSQFDENVLEKYVGDEEITADDLRRAVRAATRRRRGRARALRHRVQEQGCAAAARRGRRLPAEPARRAPRSPGSSPARTSTRSSASRADDEPFAALAFKIMSDPYVGKLTYFRVYSGKLSAGSPVLNATKDSKERVGRILQMHANHREDKDAVFAGDIVAVVGLKNTTTGDTLCDPAHPIVLERMEFPEPVISVAIEPKTKVDQDKLGKALGALSEEDPTFQVRTDEETGQTIIARHGRAPPRRARRPHGARVLGRRQRRQAAGRLPRDHHRPGREDRGALHPPDRRRAASTATS